MDLSLLLSPNNQEREASEKQLEQFIKQDGNGAMKSLVETMVVCGDSAIRGLAAVLIRRFIIQRKIKWKELSEETRGGVLEGFNHSLENERVGDVQKKVADSAAEVYRSVKKSGGEWSGLVNFLGQAASSNDGVKLVITFRMIYYAPSLIDGTAVEFISGLFEHGMMNAEANVRFEALKSYVETFGSVSTRMRKGMYGPMKIVSGVLGSLVEEESMLNESMTCLIEFIPKFSKATKMIYGELYKFVVSLLGKEDVDDEVKQSGMEMIVTIAESIPEVIDKDEEFLRVVIPNVLKMFLSVEEGEEWYKSDSDDDLNDVGSFAESGLDRLALSLDSNKMMVVLGEYLNGMFGSKVWQERYGGLMTIFSVAEGCHELMVERFEDVLKMVLVLINDESARVRYAVGSVLGQLSSDFSEKAQGEYFGLIVEALIHLMSDKVDKVKGRGVEAMVNLLDGVEKKQVVNYSDRIMSVIFELIKINDYIKTACLDVIVSIAESLKEDFVKYYEIIPILYNLFDSVKIVEYKDKEVCGKILNSISSIYNECEGEGGKKGVNGSVSGGGVSGVTTQLSTPTPTTTTTTTPSQNYLPLIERLKLLDSDDLFNYKSLIWAKLCNLMGKEIINYIQLIMNELFVKISLQPEFDIQTEDSNNELQGYEYFKLDKKKIGIKTSLLDDKETSIDLLNCIANVLDLEFLPFVNESIKLIIPCFSFIYHDGVLISSTRFVSTLIKILSKLNNSNFDLEISNLLISLNNSLINSINNDFICSALDSISESLDHLRNFNKFDLLLSLSDNLFSTSISLLEECFERQCKNLNFQKDEDAENILDEDFATDDDIVYSISRLLHSLLKFGNQFDFHFESRILPFISKSLNVNLPIYKHFAVLVFDDIIEFFGIDYSTKYHSFISSLLSLPSSNDQLQGVDPDLLQATCYGIGLLASNPFYKSFCSSLLATCFFISQSLSSLNSSTLNSSDYEAARDNAVSAAGKIIKHCGGDFIAWSRFLPLTADDEEFLDCYSILLDLLPQSQLLVNNNLDPHIAHVFKHILNNNPSQEVFKKVSDFISLHSINLS